MWTDKSPEMKEYLQSTTDMPTVPISSINAGTQPSDKIAAAGVIQVYDWQIKASPYHLKVHNVLGLLDRLETMKSPIAKPCYPIADPLTRALPKTLQTKKPEFWEAVALDLSLGVFVDLNDNGNCVCQGQAFLDVGDHVLKQRTQWMAAKLNAPPQFDAAIKISDKFIMNDPLVELRQKYQHQPPSQYMLHHNPALNGIVAQAVLSSIGKGVGEVESKELVATNMAIFYKTITSLRCLKNTWPEMDFLIDLYGLRIDLSPGACTNQSSRILRASQGCTEVQFDT
jgi:hypothetical protein